MAPDTVHESAVHHEEHHYSVWPLVVGIAFLFTYFGLATWDKPYGFPSLGLGLLTMVVAVFGWMREDTKMWPKDLRPSDAFPIVGQPVGFWGAVWFLATEVMLFGGLFAAYFAARARYGAEAFYGLGPHLPVGMTALNTGILVLSGVTLHWGLHGLQTDKRRNFYIGSVVTLILGSVFLSLQIMEYRELVHEGFVLGSNAFSTTFYMLTGTHGLHVLAGLIIILIMFVRGLAGNFDKEHHVGVEVAAIYWHFVDAVWIFLFVVIYLRWI